MALKDLSMPALRQQALAMGMSQAHVDTARNANQLVHMIKNYQPAPPPPPAPPTPPPVQAVPKPPLRITKKQTVGVKKNTKTKNKSKDNLRIGRTANVQPLQAGAVGYTGLRIS